MANASEIKVLLADLQHTQEVQGNNMDIFFVVTVSMIIFCKLFIYIC